MKQCPACRSTYTDDSLVFCLNDGAKLFALSSSADATEELSFGNKETFRPGYPKDSPTIPFHPAATIEAIRKGKNPILVLSVLALLTVIGIAGAGIAYFAFVKKDNSAAISSMPTVSETPIQNGGSDQTRELKEKLDKLERQLEDQKKTNKPAPSLSVPSQIPVQVLPPAAPSPKIPAVKTGRVNSPKDGFLALRSSPNHKTGAQVLQIPHGATVNVSGCKGYSTVGNRQGRWCQVNYGGASGWVFDAWLNY